MDKKLLTLQIRDKALELGFVRVGITTADDFSDYASEVRGRTPSYDFLIDNPNGTLIGAYPRRVMPEAKSIVCIVYDYSHILYPKKLTECVGRAYLSRAYLPLPDTISGARLQVLKDFLTAHGCKIGGTEVDLPARAACARAGVITYGKNNFAYAQGCGSFIILNTILVDTELEYDQPTMKRPCPPDCTRCIDACPTGALYAPGKLNPQRCLLLRHIRPDYPSDEVCTAMGSRIHGCDICQEVCPRNLKPLAEAAARDPFLEMLKNEFDLEKILLMDGAYYQRVIHPIMYNYIWDIDLFRRNAAIALGNSGDPAHIPALKKALGEGSPMVREAVVWALRRIGGTFL